jgi:hypothetical protein
MAVTKAAVDSAVKADGTQYAPLELKSAQDKLTAANTAMATKDYKKADRLAEQAQVDAQLADVKARAVKAQKAVQDSQEGLRVLHQELERNGTDQNQLQNAQ